MTLARTVAVTFTALALSNFAFAQHGGHDPGPGGPPRGGPRPDSHEIGGPLLVASDGKALVVEHTTATSGSTTTTTTRLVAVSTAGAVAWSFTAPSRIQRIALPDSLVAVSVETGDSATPAAPAASQIIALSLSTGTQQWTHSLDGVASDLQATSSGLLCIVSKFVAATTSGSHGTVTRTLVAINLSGNVAWSLPLN